MKEIVYIIQGNMSRPMAYRSAADSPRNAVVSSVSTMSNGERALTGWWFRRTMIIMSNTMVQMLYATMNAQEEMITEMKSGVNSSLLSSSIGKALILSLLLECIRLSDMVHKLGDKYRTSFPVFPCACVCECEYVCSMFEAQRIVDPIHTMVDKSVHWLTECDI